LSIARSGVRQRIERRSPERSVPDRLRHADAGPAAARRRARQDGDTLQTAGHHYGIGAAGPEWPIDPEIHKNAPHAKYVRCPVRREVRRKGEQLDSMRK
jgi:hypothetical protein